LKIQKTFIIGRILKGLLNVWFPEKIIFGDIVSGLKVKENSCDGLYCSHVFEHLSYDDLIISLKNSYKILKLGGVFRIVLPDMEFLCKEYLSSLEKSDPDCCNKLMKDNCLGVKERKKGLKSLLTYMYGNSKHLWMWDYNPLSKVLAEVVFTKIRRCKFNDADDKMFLLVENKQRFENCLSIEVVK
jgi:SAM-dependent methyltransferase